MQVILFINYLKITIYNYQGLVIKAIIESLYFISPSYHQRVNLKSLTRL